MIDFLRGSYDMDFYLAAIPVQVLFLVYYMRKRKLPLKDTMYFTNLMYFNLAAMIAGILSAAACAGWETTPVPVIYGLNVGYHLFVLLAAYNGFRYVMETLHAGDRINPKWMRLAAVPVLPMALVIFVSQFFGSMISVDPETGIHQGSLYPLFYGFLIFYLVLCLATALVFRTEDNEGQVEGILTAGAFIMAGILLEGYYWQELFLSFSFTMGIAVIYLTVRNPDLFLDHKTELMTREAFRMIMRQLLEKNDFEGFGFVIRDYDECRMAYGGAFVDGFLGYFGKYLRQEFSKQYLFYMGGGRFFIVSTLPMDLEAEVSKVHERFRKPWGRDGKIAYFDINCCILDDTLVFSSVDELKQCIGIAFETADSPKHEDVIIDKGYQERVKRQFHVRGLLEESLAGSSLEVFLQPLVEASSGRVEGAEALVRMKDKDGSIVGPAEFIDMASATGAVSILGEQVFAKVCEFIRDGGLEACGMKWVHVNVGQCSVCAVVWQNA